LIADGPTTDYVSLTEVSGEEVSREQVERMARRYYWACRYCKDRDVLEAACGAGQGVGYLAAAARRMTAGDISDSLLSMARAHYGGRFSLQRFDAERMPFPDGAFDVVVLFEALYYLPEPRRFFAECRRVLRPGGTLLIATANKDLFDFTPSPHSHHYFGVVELGRELGAAGFTTECFGDTPVTEVSARQRILRPVKAVASRIGIIPKSMAGKKLLKRLVFGSLEKMPAEVTAATAADVPPAPLPPDTPDLRHKVILCAATRRS
jgi:SAM-dependent methyltransferase